MSEEIEAPVSGPNPETGFRRDALLAMSADSQTPERSSTVIGPGDKFWASIAEDAAAIRSRLQERAARCTHARERKRVEKLADFTQYLIELLHPSGGVRRG
jgi:hypothetical protein